MKKFAAAACVMVALLGSSTAHAQSSTSSTTMVSTDPVTGKKTTRPATEAERAQVRAIMESIRPSLARMESDLAGLKNLEADLAGLGNLEADLAGMKEFGSEMARLQRMVETETPVSTTKTSKGTVRVYRDGTTVTDEGDSRTFQIPDRKGSRS